MLTLSCMISRKLHSLKVAVSCWHATDLLFVLQLEAADDWEDVVDEIIAEFEQETARQVTYTICFY